MFYRADKDGSCVIDRHIDMAELILDGREHGLPATSILLIDLLICLITPARNGRVELEFTSGLYRAVD